jgi:cytochrome oxidase Cu insertion factor (SCO1/SenC/PrrC family)
MPGGDGINSGRNAAGLLVAAFRSALLHQLSVVAVLFALLLACWLVRDWLARGRATAAPALRLPAADPEPRARRVLRIGFGILWLVDGVLQAQPQMVNGLSAQVILPSASSSPLWVQHLVNFSGTILSYHPVQAAAAAVWIQVGIGLWLVAAPSGWSSRLAGLAGVAWGLIVWVFGEAFGGIFAPGLSWLTGAPGAVLIYVAAGALLVLPASAWAGPRLGRIVLAGTGLFWVGLAVLQAWPGRGYWQGGTTGALTGMVRSMAQNSQPHAQAATVSAFGSLTSAHGFAVNLVAVLALGLLGLALLSGRRRLLDVAIPAAVVFCLADWVLVQDFGIPGGLGTDPNSMVPWLLLIWAGYRAITPAPARVPEPAGAAGPAAPLRTVVVSASARTLTALGAVGVVIVGAAPLAAASVSRTADPIVARSVAGAPVTVNRPAPGFRLVSQAGRPVSLASLHGRVTLLTFLDPTCSDCTIIARELRAADTMLGGPGQRVEIVAIAATATHLDTAFIRAFDQQAGLSVVGNWMFLTGNVSQLEQVWTRYEQVAPNMMSGMTVHSSVAFIIDGAGRIRAEVKDDPGPGTASMQSSFAVVLAGAARQAMGTG